MDQNIKKMSDEIKAKLLETLATPAMQETIANMKASTEDTGTFEVIISTADIDRQGESIMQDGWDLTNYKQNPVVLWGHDYYAPPIGVCDEIGVVDGKLVAKGRFADHPFAQQVRKLYDDGMLRTTSVGFIAREMDGTNITKAELLEFSFVPVPANPMAVSLRKATDLGIDLNMLAIKGLNIEIKAEDGDECTMDDGTMGMMKPNADGEMVCMTKAETKPEPEAEGDFIIIRVKDPEYFDQESFRTIEISAEKGIKATVGCKSGEYEGGKCSIGVEVQRYLFDKEKWDEAKAQAWVDENAKSFEEKGMVADAVVDEDEYEVKWARLDPLCDIIDALFSVYLKEETKADQFDALLTETIGLMQALVSKAPEMAPTEASLNTGTVKAHLATAEKYLKRKEEVAGTEIVTNQDGVVGETPESVAGKETAGEQAPTERSNDAGQQTLEALEKYNNEKAVLREIATIVSDALTRVNAKQREARKSK